MPDEDVDSEPERNVSYILYSCEYSKIILHALLWRSLFILFYSYKILSCCMLSVTNLFIVTLFQNNSQLAQQNKEMTIHGMDS